ncbi:MAG: MbeB family mobilization protein [Plesiomonas sp.]
MSEILNLAQEFESKSKQQAKTTEQSVKIAFEMHETSINEALKLSTQSIQRVIKDQTKQQISQLRQTIVKTWGISILLTLILFSILAGILWYQGLQVIERQQELTQYNQILSDLKDNTGAGLAILPDKKRKKQYFLILPKNAHIVDQYISDSKNQIILYKVK